MRWERKKENAGKEARAPQTPATHCNALQCTAILWGSDCCGLLQCVVFVAVVFEIVAVGCSVLSCVAVVFEIVEVGCSAVLFEIVNWCWMIAWWWRWLFLWSIKDNVVTVSALQCFVVWHVLLQCACSVPGVLQCVAVWWCLDDSFYDPLKIM